MSVLPFDQRDGFIWMNGQLLPWADAKLHVLSHGLHYGSCVFEGERAYGGKIFKSPRAFRALPEVGRTPRLRDSLLASTSSTRPRSSSSTKNGFTNCYVRPVAWRGSEMMAVAAQNSTINVAIAIWDWPSMFDVEREDARHPSRHRRIPPARPADARPSTPRPRAST